MLTDALNLSVDVANNATMVSQEFSLTDRFQNRSVFIGNGHTLLSRNMISFYRSYPTKVGNFLGTAKTSVKITEDVTVSGADGVATNTVPCIGEVNFSFPVGATAAKIKEIRQRLIAVLDDDLTMDKLNVQLMV